jgi:hypothetical protein
LWCPQIIEKQVLSVVKARRWRTSSMRRSPRLTASTPTTSRRSIQQMRRAKWRAQGHGEYAEVPEKDFFAAAKASERLVCHFYLDNWPCKVRSTQPSRPQ